MYFFRSVLFSFLCLKPHKKELVVSIQSNFFIRFIESKAKTITKQMSDDEYLHKVFDSVDTGSFRSTLFFS